MTPERWQQVEHVYHLVVARPEGERPAAMAELCGSDEMLRNEVGSLLAQEAAASAFLEAPPFGGAVTAAGAGVEPGFVGRRFGSYRVSSLLGAGGMGEVYRAHDEQLGRDVAIKVLPQIFSSDPRRRERFEREARMLAALNHPAIGAIYGHADVDGGLALVLELVDGETLAERMVRPVSVAEALAIARPIAEALEAAHERGIVIAI
jgi:serine/threonine protein kinase